MDLYMILLLTIFAFIAGYAIAWIVQLRKVHSAGTEQTAIIKDYVLKTQHDEVRQEVTTAHREIARLTGENAHQEAVIEGLNVQLERDKKDLEELQKRFSVEFENLAQRIFEEKSHLMTKASEEKIQAIIKPFNEKMVEFGNKVEDTYRQGTRERSGLKEQIKFILEAQNQLSSDALRLTQALKGDSQFQGSWGEIQLKRLLESSGLQEGVHFDLQGTYRDEEGNRLRPDVIIKLPDDKHLILDSKVSLVAFEQYFNSETEEERQKALDAHLISIRTHIRGLSDKNYMNLNGINAPDYVLMFMPLEPAFIAAVQSDPQLYEKAFAKNIAVVSPSTLMATLRTVSYIWKNENQNRNVIEIAKEGAALYDKFVGFLEDMEGLGRRLEKAQTEYNNAMNKLTTSSRKGSTIIGRVERLRELGANPSKSIQEKFLSAVSEV